ncbi:hypothetical protein Btru_056266 [Bulinus truncatus]|nr:hypothetical protein Btru_056266 [Bulinus truncatus]
MISGLPTNYVVTPIRDEYKTSESALWHVNEKRRIRHMRFPSLKYRHDNDSLQENINVNNSFKKWNDDGEYRSSAPCRDFDSLLDPTSGFVSAGTDVNMNNGSNLIKSFVQINKTPQAVCPNTANALEQSKTLFQPMSQREKTWASGESSLWNSRKTLDVVIRSKLGGWTSSEDPRKLSEDNKRPQTSPIDEMSRLRRDKLALKYQYGTSTQSQLREEFELQEGQAGTSRKREGKDPDAEEALVFYC